MTNCVGHICQECFWEKSHVQRKENTLPNPKLQMQQNGNFVAILLQSQLLVARQFGATFLQLVVVSSRRLVPSHEDAHTASFRFTHVALSHGARRRHEKRRREKRREHWGGTRNPLQLQLQLFWGWLGFSPCGWVWAFLVGVWVVFLWLGLPP